MALEIDDMLTISTAHVTEDTCNRWLHAPVGVVAYQKGGHGWFVHVGDDGMNAERTASGEVPEDLMAAIALARSKSCAWLCLDQDGGEVDDLKTYDW
jgi:hypothetical protein